MICEHRNYEGWGRGCPPCEEAWKRKQTKEKWCFENKGHNFERLPWNADGEVCNYCGWWEDK